MKLIETVPTLTRAGTVVPAASLLVLAAVWGSTPGVLLIALVALALCGAVQAAVQHAEMVAHRAGEPFGSLVLAVAAMLLVITYFVGALTLGGRSTVSASASKLWQAMQPSSFIRRCSP